MSRLNGLHGVPNLAPPAPQIAVASPLNDVQLVALVAAHLWNMPTCDAIRAVQVAQDIVFHAVTQQDALGERIKEHRRQPQG